MCSLDLEPCDVWHEEHVTARKEHKCDCCGGPILPGQQYLKHFDKFDGEITSEKMCLACEADREDFARHHEGSMANPGYTKELVIECMSDTHKWKERLHWARMLRRMDKRAELNQQNAETV